MTELERRALLGDADAQKECTEKGIVLPCPFCGAKIIYSSDGTLYGLHSLFCFFQLLEDQEVDITKDQINSAFLKSWNTRSAPPIGRCAECQKWGNKECMYNGATFSNDYCSYFEPKQT